MKRILIVAVTLIVSACAGPIGGTPGGGTAPHSGGGGGSSGGGSGNGGGGSGGGDGTTVHGTVVRGEDGRPYPNAWVRFGELLSSTQEAEAHTVTDSRGRFAIDLPAGQYRVSAGDECDLNARFDIVGRVPDDVMITIPGQTRVDFVESPITPGWVDTGTCAPN